MPNPVTSPPANTEASQSSTDSRQTELRIMLVDDQPQRATVVEHALQEAGYCVVARLTSASGLLRQMELQRPNVVIIDMESPDRDVLESLSIISEHNPTPVMMLSQQADKEFIASAIQAGVSVYMADGINLSRVQSLIEVTIAQFDAFQSLRQALASTRSELAERKTIEQAKGLLMAHQRLTEAEAHRRLRRLAMDNNQKMVDVAANVIDILQRNQS